MGRGIWFHSCINSWSSYGIRVTFWNRWTTGKGESNWDRFLHDPPFPIHGNATGDVACDSYHKWQEDIQMLKDLNVGLSNDLFLVNFHPSFKSWWAPFVLSSRSGESLPILDQLGKNTPQRDWRSEPTRDRLLQQAHWRFAGGWDSTHGKWLTSI